jgi:NAD-dependent dihydropyrimidine dehydrogenase PreA subunit
MNEVLQVIVNMPKNYFSLFNSMVIADDGSCRQDRSCVCVCPLTCPTSKKLPGFRCDELGGYNSLLSILSYIYTTLQTTQITAM